MVIVESAIGLRKGHDGLLRERSKEPARRRLGGEVERPGDVQRIIT